MIYNRFLRPHREQLQAAEEQITLRSCLCESRWSSEDVTQPTSNRAATTTRVLQVLEILDRQNFGRIDHINFIQRLYEKVFAVVESKENEVNGGSKMQPSQRIFLLLMLVSLRSHPSAATAW